MNFPLKMDINQINLLRSQHQFPSFGSTCYNSCAFLRVCHGSFLLLFRVNGAPSRPRFSVPLPILLCRPATSQVYNNLEMLLLNKRDLSYRVRVEKTGRPPEDPTQTAVQRILKVADDEVHGRYLVLCLLHCCRRMMRVFPLASPLTSKASAQGLLRTNKNVPKTG